MLIYLQVSLTPHRCPRWVPTTVHPGSGEQVQLKVFHCDRPGHCQGSIFLLTACKLGWSVPTGHVTPVEDWHPSHTAAWAPVVRCPRGRGPRGCQPCRTALPCLGVPPYPVCHTAPPSHHHGIGVP